MSSEKLVVIGDQHGREDRMQAIWDFYGDSVDGYVLAGDIVDGPDTKGAIDIATKYMGAVLVRGNHEGHLLTAMFECDEDVRQLYASYMWPQIHDRVLESYGIYPDIPTPGNALRLRDKMPDKHQVFLRESKPYIETDEFVVVHAGLSADTWAMQRQYLRAIEALNRSGMYIIEGENGFPYQLGEGQKRVEETNLKKLGLQKTLLSGHFHMPSSDPATRTRNNGQHLLLATPKKADFSVVYESWTKQLKAI